MILQRLAEHYDRIVAQGDAEVAPPGKSVQKISFCIVLHPDGTLQSIADEREQDGKRLRARSEVVPGQAKPSGSGLNPCFLWDNAEYLLGWSADPTRKARAVKAFEASRDRHLALREAIDHPEFEAVCRFMSSWQPAQADALEAELLECATNFGGFRIVGRQHYVHQVVALPANEEPGVAATEGCCLVTGVRAPVARLHEPKIKGVAGAQAAGALLVSFNASAFTSYGKDQSYNAPVSQDVTFRYTNALNHLLGSRDRRVSLGDATVVFWADHATPLEDAFSAIFSGLADAAPEEDSSRVAEARLLLQQMRSGTQNITLPGNPEVSTRFFILGLSPNASRLSVRLWVEESASELRRHLAQHVQDLALAGGRQDAMLPVWQIVQATGRAERDRATGRFKGFDTKAVSPQLAGELVRSVLTGVPYPHAMLATMVRRIRSDGEVAWSRVSAIKATLARAARMRERTAIVPQEGTAAALLEMTMELNEQNQSAAYRCGRIFAVLERAQEQSVTQENPAGKLNATIKDRFFGAAAATPLLVLPRLLVLNNHHQRKLKDGTRRYLNQLLGTIMQGEPFAFPRQLNLEQQGEFIVGYFQQRQAFYRSREEREKETELEGAEITQ